MPAPYVLHIAKWYPNSDDDLEGVFIQRHIESISSKYISVVLFAKATSGIKEKNWFKTEEQNSGNAIAFYAYYKKQVTGIAFLDKVIKAILYLYLMRRFVRSAINRFGKPALIHAHVLLRPALVAYWYSRKMKVPYLLTEHSTFYTSIPGRSGIKLIHMLRKFVVRKATAVITVSNDLEQGMKAWSLFNSNYYRVFNCVDTRLFSFKKKLISETFNLLHVSEFKDEHKNILGLLKVAGNLAANGFHIKLHMVGYGKDLSVILKYIEDYALNEVVLYHGKIVGEQLPDFYQAADAFVLFSNKENMPCVIAESLCCGTPVISTRVGGIAEVVHDGNGILIEKNNENQLYQAIATMIQKRRSFNDEQISREANQLFSFESIGNRIVQIYDTLLNTSKLG